MTLDDVVSRLDLIADRMDLVVYILLYLVAAGVAGFVVYLLYKAVLQFMVI